jgi:hypothetical protein
MQYLTQWAETHWIRSTSSSILMSPDHSASSLVDKTDD